ncbi:hypothetical protein [Frankia sp. Cas3]|uniref:hypothetical protein n=1 Tax=Frankia sp. Cas3 TaxID=3073926 RepID=UPI002AD50AF9|nr:hypothetical protein [Frankia sp. Cas3]
MPYSPTGKNADPEFCRERARLASVASRDIPRTIGRITDPTTAATVAVAAVRRAAELAADGPIDPAVLDEVRALLGPISKAAKTAIDREAEAA